MANKVKLKSNIKFKVVQNEKPKPKTNKTK